MIPFTRDAVVAYSRSLIGTPFHDGAALPGVGCDCIGVMRCIAKYFERPEGKAFDNDIRFKGYSRFPNKRQLIEGCDSYFDRVPIHEGLPGDVALARVEIEPQHFAIITSIDPTYIVHAYIQVGRVVENRVDDAWRKLLLRMYRFRGIE